MFQGVLSTATRRHALPDPASLPWDARPRRKEHPITTPRTPATTVRVLRTASLALAGLGAAVAMGALGSWLTSAVLLVATVGALFVVWRTPGGAAASRAVLPVLIVVIALTVVGALGAAGVLAGASVWAALGAYVVAWAEYLVSQTIARSRGTTPR